MKIDKFDIIYYIWGNCPKFLQDSIEEIKIPTKDKWVNFEKRNKDLGTKVKDVQNNNITRIKITFQKPLLYFYVNGNKTEVKELPYNVNTQGININILGFTKDLKLRIKIKEKENENENENENEMELEHGEEYNNGKKLCFLLNLDFFRVFRVKAILILSDEGITIGEQQCGDFDVDIKIPDTNCFLVKRDGSLQVWDGTSMDSAGNIVDAFNNYRNNYFECFNKFSSIQKKQNRIILELEEPLPLSQLIQDPQTQKNILLHILSHQNIPLGENIVFHNERYGFLVQFDNVFKNCLSQISKLLS